MRAMLPVALLSPFLFLGSFSALSTFNMKGVDVVCGLDTNLIARVCADAKQAGKALDKAGRGWWSS